MPGNVTITFADGNLGQSGAESTDLPIVLLGYCSAGVTGTLYSFGGASPALVKSTIGVGPLAQGAAAVVATPNHRAVYVMPLASSAGTKTAVTETGTAPPDITLSGNPHDIYDAVVQILTAGVRGVATFRYSLDGEVNWSAEILTAATYLIPDSGITLNFATGTPYAVDNEYTFQTTAPTHSPTQISDGLDALLASGLVFDSAFVLSTPADDTAADAVFDGLSTDADGFESANRFSLFFFQSHSAASSGSSDQATWRAELVVLQAGWENWRVNSCAGLCTMVSALDGRTYSRGAIFPVACRIASAPISEHLGRVASGSINVSAIEHDEETVGGLEAYRFTTLRTIGGLPGFWINAGQQMATPGSDYGPTEHARVINSFATIVRAGALRYLNDDLLVRDDGTGRLAEDEANSIDTDLTMQAKAELVSGSPRHATSVSATVSRSNDFLTTERLDIAGLVVPKGYARAIAVDLSFSRGA